MSCVSVNYRTSADELSPYFAVVLELTVIAFINFFLAVCGMWGLERERQGWVGSMQVAGF